MASTNKYLSRLEVYDRRNQRQRHPAPMRTKHPASLASPSIAERGYYPQETGQMQPRAGVV
jgi:hypothetical protein